MRQPGDDKNKKASAQGAWGGCSWALFVTSKRNEGDASSTLIRPSTARAMMGREVWKDQEDVVVVV
ncbi:hypothetical protein NL533_34555, partial [Klebsiella pneumoniae]|nr:hypothetical protein [Klebsiella pneumoniae]